MLIIADADRSVYYIAILRYDGGNRLYRMFHLIFYTSSVIFKYKNIAIWNNR